MKSTRNKRSSTTIRNDHGFYCNCCHKLCSGAPYSFGGGFACESGVRAYYAAPGYEMSTADMAEELRCRAKQATRTAGNRRRGLVYE